MRSNLEGSHGSGRRSAGRGPRAAAVLLTAVVPLAWVHPEAVLESDRTTVDAGGALPLRGSQFGENGTYALRLLGTFDDYDLGEAKSDGDGRFAMEVVVPVDVRPGAYRVIAVASDGDVLARLAMSVHAAAMAMGGEEHAETSDRDMADMAHQARGDEIRIERDRSGVEWGVIGLIIGGVGGLGIGLRRGRTAV